MNNPADVNKQDLVQGYPLTRWLLPAALTEFDPRCSSNNLEEALQANCSLIGTFASCSTRCGLDPQQEALWDDLPDTILGFPRSAWGIADGQVWQDIRGMLAGFRSFNNQTTGADVFVLMETSPSSSYIEAFSNYSDRAFWIVNQTAAVKMEHVVLGDLPVFNTWDTSSGFNCDYANSPKSDGETFDFQPGAMQYTAAQCFAASNPDADGTSLGQKSGPSGVYCSSTDFPALYNHNCTVYSDAAPCVLKEGGTVYYPWRYQMNKKCQVGLKSSLLKQFGSALLPSVKTGGTANVACGWHWVYVKPGNGGPDKYCSQQASCGLAKPDSNKYGVQICYGPTIKRSSNSASRCPSSSDCYYGKDASYSLCSQEDLLHSSDYICQQDDFRYPWFASGLYYKQTDTVPPPDSVSLQQADGWSTPGDSATRQMFRLPIMTSIR